MIRKWTDEQLIEAINTSNSTSEVTRKLGDRAEGAYFNFVKKKIKDLNLDISHFTHLHRGNLSKIPENEIFIKKYIHQKMLRRKVRQSGFLKEECSSCFLRTWKCNLTDNKEVKIPLQLDHIDGDCCNNTKENLRYLCPTCHALTSTYCGRNIKNKSNKKICPVCKNKKHSSSNVCKNCVILPRQKTKINWPSIEELENKLKEMPCNKLAKILGVSDVAIKKRIKNRRLGGLEAPSTAV